CLRRTPTRPVPLAVPPAPARFDADHAAHSASRRHAPAVPLDSRLPRYSRPRWPTAYSRWPGSGLRRVCRPFAGPLPRWLRTLPLPYPRIKKAVSAICRVFAHALALAHESKTLGPPDACGVVTVNRDLN